MSTINQYMVHYVMDRCLVGRCPETNSLYKTDSQCLCIDFNRYLQSVFHPTVTTCAFNKLIGTIFGVTKLTSGGRNTLLGITRRDDIRVHRQHQVHESDTQRREARTQYYKDYYRRNREQQGHNVNPTTVVPNPIGGMHNPPTVMHNPTTTTGAPHITFNINMYGAPDTAPEQPQQNPVKIVIPKQFHRS